MHLLACCNEIFTSVITLVTIGSEVPIIGPHWAGRLDSHVTVGMIYSEVKLSGQCSVVTEDTRDSQ